MFRKIFLLIFLVICALKIFAIEKKNLSQIRTILEEQEKIRILTNYAPGHGHQAANLTVMRKLKALGFNGFFELIYNTDWHQHGSDPEIKMIDKFEAIMPGLDKESDKIQLIDGMKIKMIPEIVFQKMSKENVLLTITGAIDDSTICLEASEGRKFVLQMMPDDWRQREFTIFYDGNIIFRDSDVNLTHFAEVSQIEKIFEIIDETMSNNIFQNKANGLKELFSVIEAHEFLPAYGLGINGEEKISNMISSLTISKGVDKDLFKGGTIIGMLSNLSESELSNALNIQNNHFNRLQKIYNEKSRGFFLKKIDVIPKIKTVNITDPDIANVLSAIGKDDILIVKIGNLPQRVFETVISSATLPATVAGANGLSLMRYLGIPFLNTVGTPGVKEEIKLIESAVLQLRKHDPKNGVNSLVEYYLESKKINSKINKFYKGASRKIREHKEDKTPYTLLKLFQTMLEVKRDGLIRNNNCLNLIEKVFLN